MGEDGGWPLGIADPNRDGHLTPGDVVLWLQHVFFAPGEYLLSMISEHVALLSSFAAQTAGHGVVSGFLSAAVWVSLIVLVRKAYAAVRYIDQVVTAFLNCVSAAFVRTGRRLRTRMMCTLAGIRKRLIRAIPDAVSACATTQFELGDLEVGVLQSYCSLAPGYLRTASDITDALSVRLRSAQEAMDRLSRLGLIDSTFSTTDGEDGYRLTVAGEEWLKAYGRSGSMAAIVSRSSETGSLSTYGP